MKTILQDTPYMAHDRKNDKHLTILSPAKVNLFLKVLSKRPDGYHNIVSIVDLVSLYDVISFEESKNDEIIIKDDKGILPDGDANTIYRAIIMLRDRCDIQRGVKVFVEKHIPVGGGLGGPSSNAAAALNGLVKFWDIKIEVHELFDIGKRIGADVPLFIYGKPCVMRGIGEEIAPIELPLFWYVIVYPDVMISTKAVYEGLKIVLTKKENDIRLLQHFYSVRDVAGLLENDLETVAIPMCPKIKEIKDRMIQAGAIGALMSGSGSSVFGVFESEDDAKRASLNLEGMGSIFIVHSVK